MPVALRDPSVGALERRGADERGRLRLDQLLEDPLEVDTRVGDYGEYPIVSVLTDDGREIAFHGFHTVARQELARKRPKPGDRLGIKFLGPVEGKDYVGYRLVVERAEPVESTGPDWTSIGVEAEQELVDGPSWGDPPS